MNTVPIINALRTARTFCATCSCPSLAACIDRNDLVGGLASLASLAAAAASRKFRSPNAGFVYVAGKKATTDVHSGPSSTAPSVGQQPYGVRLVYRDIATDHQGNKWYYVETPAGGGWVSSGDTSDHRPSRPAPSGPIHLIDTGPAAQSSGGSTTSARG